MGEGGRLKRKGIYVYIELIHTAEYSRNEYNTVKQLYSNKNNFSFILKKKKVGPG